MIRSTVVVLFTLAVNLSAVILDSQAEAQTFLTRHTRDVVLNGTAPLIGPAAESQSMSFDVVLALHHEPELLHFLNDIYDPFSPDYGHYLTPSQFTKRFGPSQEELDAVVQFAKANGLTVTGGSLDSRDIQMTGTVGNVESAFHLQINRYWHPTEDRIFFAPDREPTVNLPFQLWHITGLDNYSIPRPMLSKGSSNAAAGSSSATTGSGPDASFLGSDMRAAYYGSDTLTGSGQSIGLLEYAGTDLEDLTTYYQNIGQTEPYTPTLVSVDDYGTSCVYDAAGDYCDDTEQTLDMTQAMGMAPGSAMLYMFVCGDVIGNSGTFSDTACLSAMANASPLPLNLSSSWTWSPPDPSIDDPYFEQMAVDGQSFFQAAGDDGAYSGIALWPANSAHVIAVGGTDLSTESAGGPWTSETAWADGGGGYGTNVDIPSWQVDAVAACASCNQTYRNVPDVAANANYTFYVCADQTTCTENYWGGTSFAAPMWAGYLALANQQAAANGAGPLGFINPLIYSLNLGNGDADFHDVTSGSNGATCSSGYNECDGWGSPNGPDLISALVAGAPPSLPSGDISTVAGNGTQGYSGDGGAATSAELWDPYDVAVDSRGDIYIADTFNERIRKVTVSTGVITTVAGSTRTAGYSGDGGPATSAELDWPMGVAVDASGNIYIADYYNQCIRKVTASTGIITTVAGDGTQGYSGDGGAATSAKLNLPTGVAVDSSGNIYIADWYNYRIRKVTVSTGIITTVAGDGTGGYSGDGGAATSAELYYPSSVALDASGNIYIADADNYRVRKVTASTGIITTVAGDGTAGYSGDGGAATSAELDYPYGVALDASGNLYITDVLNERIREVTAATGIITTVAGDGTQGYSGDGGLATSAELHSPMGVALDLNNNIYFPDIINERIRAVGAE